MRKTRFWKLSGAGNDFVLLAGLPRGRSGAALARVLCDRRRGVGADGLLVLSRRGGRARLDYWNADGSPAFCGNGSRCGALWAASQGWVKGRAFTLDTGRGPLAVRLTAGGRAEVRMPRPKGLKLAMKVAGYTVHFVDTGVPHAVVFMSKIGDIASLGRLLRSHKAFGKAGANVDFVSAAGGRLAVRTYERGVEGETLACGTGVVAAAVVANALGYAGTSVPVRARSGDDMTVTLADDGPRLEGPGRVVFTGEVSI
ncbi:MAG: diaminopimelate epimerase [Elusimicrobiota bacterium]|nr:diaminopimelate epimerase [Elusimicrobiota bacterium]